MFPVVLIKQHAIVGGYFYQAGFIDCFVLAEVKVSEGGRSGQDQSKATQKESMFQLKHPEDNENNINKEKKRKG